MSDCEFETYRKQLCDAIIALGDNEDELKKLECDDSIGGIEFSSDDVINDENTAEAKTLKELGNKEFSCENHEKAIKYYTSAILLSGLPSNDRAMLYSNRCVCYFKLNDIEKAVKDAKDTVKLWPQWWKGYYRLAQVYNAKDNYKSLTKAEKCLIQAQAYEKNNEISELLNKVRQKVGSLERYDFSDYRSHLTSTEEIVDYCNKMNGLNISVDLIKEKENLNANSDNPVFNNLEECRRGHRYRCGTDGFPLDYERAVQCYSKAANRGSAEGLYNLSQMYSEGKGVKQDFDLSLQYLLKTAQQPPYINVGPMKMPNKGVAEAEHSLGLCYEIGVCVKKDLIKAIEWYEKAVDHESSSSANNLGLIYMNGVQFVDKDLDKAEQLFKFAVTKGDPNAMVNIALLYLEKDEPELAMLWCERIRNKGYYFPNSDHIETIARQRLSELEKAYKDVSKGLNMNNDGNSYLTLKEKIFQKLSETAPQGVNLLQKLKEINEQSFNESKSPVNKLVSSGKEKYDLQTLVKYANSGKLYAEKLLTAKIHFLKAIKVLQSIQDINNPSNDECRNFIKHLSLSVQIEMIVSFVNETIEQLVSFALNKKTSYDEDVRICYATINMKDIDGNINFLNKCLKLHPKNAFFLQIRGCMHAFRKQYEKSIRDLNSALKLVPNDYEILYLKAASMSKLENIDHNLTIEAYNKFLSLAPEDHRKIPASYYSMAELSFVYEKNYTNTKKYYNMGIISEQKQLSFFLPYDWPFKSQFELILQLKQNKNIPDSEVDSELKKITPQAKTTLINVDLSNVGLDEKKSEIMLTNDLEKLYLKSCTSETLAEMRLNESEDTFEDISEPENLNISKLIDKFEDKLMKTLPQDIKEKVREMIEKNLLNEGKKLLLVSNQNKYDYKTLEKYANSGKMYAKRLFLAKIHFVYAVNVLRNIMDKNTGNPSTDECRKFIKRLSQCYQTESIVVEYVTELHAQVVSFALNNNIDCDEDVRICYAALKMKDIDENFNFINQCIKLYPQNVFFVKTRGCMYGFRRQYEKSLLDINSALKLAPNDEKLLLFKAEALSGLDNIDYHLIIDAYNNFLSIAPEDHREIPESYYKMANLSLLCEENFNDAQKYYDQGVNAEHKQLSVFLPYESIIKSQVELYLQIKYYVNNSIPPKEVKSKNNQLTNPYRIQIIKNHRQSITEFNKALEKYKNAIKNSVKPPKEQKCAQSFAALKCICLRDMDPTTDKIYDKCVIDLKVIDIVGTTGSSLILVVEDNRKDVERCYIYNSPLLNDIKEANNLYGIGCQFSVINPYLRIARDMKPAIRIDDINSIVMREFITNMCRYCCEANATKHCSRCKTAMYCTKECQVNDYKQNLHKYICY